MLTSPAFATFTVTAERFAGADRYATSAAVSAATYTTATDIVIASGENFPDGLSAAALAGQLSAPVLLVPRGGALPDAIKTEMERLGATRGTIVGGTASVSREIATQIEDEGLFIARLAGVDRYETAHAVADAITSIGTDDGLTTAFVASGEDYPDALAASAPSSAGQHPIILTESVRLSAAAAKALTDNDIERVIIMGGTGAVTEVVEASIAALDITVERIGGINRYETATDLAAYITNDFDFDFDVDGIVVATGLGFPDALSAGPFADTRKMPIVFSEGALSEEYVRVRNDTIDDILIAGGTAHIPDARRDALILAATPPDTTPPVITASVAESGEETVTFTANEPLDIETTAISDFTVTGGNTQPGVLGFLLSVDGLSITVTLNGPLVDDNVVTLNAHSVEDLFDNRGPVDDVPTEPAS